MFLWFQQLHQEIWDFFKGSTLLLFWVGIDTNVLNWRQLALAKLTVIILVGEQQSFFQVVVAQFEVDFLGFFKQSAIEVFLVVHLIEVKRILFVLKVGTLVIDFGLLVVLRLHSSFVSKSSLMILTQLFLFSISLHVNLRQALVLIVEIHGVLDIPVAEGKGIILVVLAEAAFLVVEDVLDGLVLKGWQFLHAGGLLRLELDLFDEGEEVEVFGTHEFLGVRVVHGRVSGIEESGIIHYKVRGRKGRRDFMFLRVSTMRMS